MIYDSVKSIWKSTMNYFMSQYSNLGLTYETLAIMYDNASLSKLPNYYRELLEASHVNYNGEREKPEVIYMGGWLVYGTLGHSTHVFQTPNWLIDNPKNQQPDKLTVTKPSDEA